MVRSRYAVDSAMDDDAARVIEALKKLQHDDRLAADERAAIVTAVRLLGKECEPTSISHMNLITNRDRT